MAGKDAAPLLPAEPPREAATLAACILPARRSLTKSMVHQKMLTAERTVLIAGVALAAGLIYAALARKGRRTRTPHAPDDDHRRSRRSGVESTRESICDGPPLVMEARHSMVGGDQAVVTREMRHSMIGGDQTGACSFIENGMGTHFLWFYEVLTLPE